MVCQAGWALGALLAAWPGSTHGWCSNSPHKGKCASAARSKAACARPWSVLGAGRCRQVPAHWQSARAPWWCVAMSVARQQLRRNSTGCAKTRQETARNDKKRQGAARRCAFLPAGGLAAQAAQAGLRAVGSTAEISVPSPSAEVMVRRPPAASTRWRIPTRPCEVRAIASRSKPTPSSRICTATCVG